MQRKRIIFSLILSLAALPLMAQSSSPGKHLEVAYFSQFLVQPGLSISSSIDLQSWGITGGIAKRSLFVRPQFGYYFQANSHQSYLTNLAFGYAVQKRKRRGWAHQSLSLGIGYQLSAIQEGFSVSLADGARSARNRVYTSGWMPSISYSQGIPIQPQLSGYYRLLIGQLFENTERTSATLFAEIGLRFYFK